MMKALVACLASLMVSGGIVNAAAMHEKEAKMEAGKKEKRLYPTPTYLGNISNKELAQNIKNYSTAALMLEQQHVDMQITNAGNLYMRTPVEELVRKRHPELFEKPMSKDQFIKEIGDKFTTIYTEYVNTIEKPLFERARIIKKELDSEPSESRKKADLEYARKIEEFFSKGE